MTNWIKISDQKPVAPFWAKIKGDDEIRLYKQESSTNEYCKILSATQSIVIEIEYWKPAEIPTPPEPERSELEKAFEELKKYCTFSKENEPCFKQMYLNGFHEAIQVLEKKTDGYPVGAAIIALKKFRGEK